MKAKQKMAPKTVRLKSFARSFCPAQRVLLGCTCWSPIEPSEQARCCNVLLCRMLMFMGRKIRVIFKLVDSTMPFSDTLPL